MSINVLLINQKSSELVNLTILSINKTTPRAHIYILNNQADPSTEFKSCFDNITVLNNQFGLLVDVVSTVGCYIKNYYEVELGVCILWFADTFRIPFIHISTGSIVKEDLHNFVSEDRLHKMAIGYLTTHTFDSYLLNKIDPSIVYLNPTLLREKGIKFFNRHKSGAGRGKYTNLYSLGVSFVSELLNKRLEYDAYFLEVPSVEEYIIVPYNTLESISAFMQKHYHLIEGDIPNVKRAICLAFNDDYYYYGKALISSLIDHNKWYSGDIIIMGDLYTSLSDEHLLELLSIYPNTFYRTYNRDRKTEDFISKFLPIFALPNFYWSYLKLYMFTLEEYDLILYLDSDIIINGSIREIFKSQDAINLAVDAYWTLNTWHYVDNRYMTDKWERCLDEYCNAGVIYLGNKELRSAFKEGFLDFSLNYDFEKEVVKFNVAAQPDLDVRVPNGCCFELDMLNLYLHLLKIKKRTLPLKYNTPVFATLDLLTKASIIHYWAKPHLLESESRIHKSCRKFCINLYNKYSDKKVKTIPSSSVAVCSLIKDTPFYMLERWLAHYKLLDCDIYLFLDHGHRTKYNFDLEIFKGVSISHISEIAKTNVGKTSRGAFEYQVPLYNSIYLELKDYYNWVTILDDDEFLYMDFDLLNSYQKESAVLVPWKIYVRDCIFALENLDGFELVPPTKLPEKIQKYMFKPILNTSVLSEFTSVHFGDAYGRYVFNGWDIPNDVLASSSPDLSDDILKTTPAWIDHYLITSFEEAVYKVYDRGDTMYIYDGLIQKKRPNKTILDYYALVNPNANVSTFLNDLSLINRRDIINKVYTNPMFYAYGLKPDEQFFSKVSFTLLRHSYGTDLFQSYLKEYGYSDLIIQPNVALLCITSKHTKKYLLDTFISYHLDKGINKIYLCTKDDLDIAEHPLVEILKYSDGMLGSNPQVDIYNWAYPQIKNSHDWIGILDDDEFIGFSLLHLYDYLDYSSVYVLWDCFLRDNAKASSDFEGYLWIESTEIVKSTPKMRYKSFANTKLCTSISNIHFATLDGITLYGTLFNSINDVPTEPVHIKGSIRHYYIRSFEEWVEKIFDRGDFYPGNRKLRTYFDLLNIDFTLDNVLKLLHRIKRKDVMGKILLQQDFYFKQKEEVEQVQCYTAPENFVFYNTLTKTELGRYINRNSISDFANITLVYKPN